jgi:hypothetical protein
VPWGTLPVVNPPAEYDLRMSHHLLLRDLVLHDPSGVGLPLVLEGRVGPILEGLDEAVAEVDDHHGTGQPLRLRLLQAVQ